MADTEKTVSHLLAPDGGGTFTSFHELRLAACKLVTDKSWVADCKAKKCPMVVDLALAPDLATHVTAVFGAYGAAHHAPDLLQMQPEVLEQVFLCPTEEEPAAKRSRSAQNSPLVINFHNAATSPVQLSPSTSPRAPTGEPDEGFDPWRSKYWTAAVEHAREAKRAADLARRLAVCESRKTTDEKIQELQARLDKCEQSPVTLPLLQSDVGVELLQHIVTPAEIEILYVSTLAECNKEYGDIVTRILARIRPGSDRQSLAAAIFRETSWAAARHGGTTDSKGLPFGLRAGFDAYGGLEGSVEKMRQLYADMPDHTRQMFYNNQEELDAALEAQRETLRRLEQEQRDEIAKINEA